MSKSATFFPMTVGYIPEGMHTLSPGAESLSDGLARWTSTRCHREINLSVRLRASSVNGNDAQGP